jgi:hypothetical protein
MGRFLSTKPGVGLPEATQPTGAGRLTPRISSRYTKPKRPSHVVGPKQNPGRVARTAFWAIDQQSSVEANSTC